MKDSASPSDSAPTPSSRPQRSRLWIAAILCAVAGAVLAATVFMTGIGVSLIVLGVLLAITAWIMEQKRSRAATGGTDQQPPPRIVP